MRHFNGWFKLPAFCLFWLTLNLATPPAQAQEYLVSVQHYSVPEGLSHRYVRYITQDSKGFIWAATHDGINRFDGFEFLQYTKEKDGLSAISCQQILEDRRGFLWLLYAQQPGEERDPGGFYPFDLFDPASGSATPFREKFQAPFSPGDITEAQSDNLGNIYILLRSGEAYRYDGFTLERLPGEPLAGVCRLAFAGKGMAGLLCRDSLIQMDSLGRILYRARLPAACDFIRAANGRFWAGRSHPDGGPYLWPVQAGELARPFYFRDGSGQPFRFAYDENYEAPVFPDRLGRWWAFIYGRLYLFGPDGKFLYDFSDDLKPFALPYPTFMYFDRRNTAWIGSSHGLLSVTIRKNPFTNYLQSEELQDTRGIVQDEQGRVYVVQQGNTWVLDSGAGARSEVGIPAWLAAARDVKGALWFGNYHNYVHCYSPYTGEKKTIYPVGSTGEGQHLSTLALFPDSASGRVWLGTDGDGLAYIDSLEKGIFPFTGYNKFQSLREASIRCFLKDGRHLWLGTSQGFYLLEPDNGITAEYSRRTGSLPFDDINHAYKDEAGIFWLATRGGGLIRWDKAAGNFRRFTQRDGLSNNVLHAVYEDENEQLWLPSNYGLMRFDKRGFQVNTYLPRDGLPHEEFNFSSHYQAPDGRLYFGGLKGVAAFYPEALYRETRQASPRLDVSQYLELDGATGAFIDKTAELLAANSIRLPPRNKSFVLKVVFPDYQSPKDNRFAYRIEGLQESWVYQPDNTIRINNLPYGSYTLHVKAQGASGRWAAKEMSLPMTVLRPFYFRWWFIALCISLCFLAIAWRMQRLRLRARKLETEVQKRTRQIEQDKEVIEKQAVELRELDEMKSRFFTNVAHELRTPITLIQGPLQLALEKTGLDKDTASMLELARSNTKSLLRLVEELLDLKKLDAGKLKLEEQSVDFYPLLRRLVVNFESSAQASNVELHLQCPAGQKLWLKLDTVKFERIILNLLSNALKFTPGEGQVQVKAEELGSRMRITVADTGCGIPAEELPYVFERFYQAKAPPSSPEGGGWEEAPPERALPGNSPPSGGAGGAGIGLALSREYAELMGGILTATSEVGKGSVFTFEFPKKEVSGAYPQMENEQRPGSESKTALTAESFPKQKPTGEASHLWGDLGGLPSPPEGLGGASPPPFTARRSMAKEGEGAGERLLLAEDNPDMRRYLNEILRPHYDILPAANGRIAMDLLSDMANEEETPALVITDIMMPEMDGFELIRRLKSSQQWQGLPVIALTARAGLDDRLSALRFGVDDYLAKPFEPAELLARAANLIRNYRQRREWLAAQKATVEEKAFFLKINPPEAIASTEQQWLAELESLALDKIGSAEFSVTDLAHLLHLSERHLRRKLKELTGLSPTEYLNEIRLQRARQLLEARAYETVAEVSYAIGLATPKHFSRLFKARFGKVPSSYF